jgi:hypothetical protein
MVSLSHLSFPLLVEEDLHMSILTIMITMKTINLTMWCRKNIWRRGKWHKSSRTGNQIVGSQDRRGPQDTSIPKMSLLIMNLSKNIYQGNTRVVNK